MIKRNKKLTAALAAAMVLTMGCGARAMTTENRTYENDFTIQLNFYDENEWNLDDWETGGTYISNSSANGHFALTGGMKQAIGDAADYWGSVLAKGSKTNHPWQLFIRSQDKIDGAIAFSAPMVNESLSWGQIKDGYEIEEYDGFSMNPTDKTVINEITFGRNAGYAGNTADYGWDVETNGIVAENGNDGFLCNLSSTAIHEMGHLLGFASLNPDMAAHMYDPYGNPYSNEKTILTGAEYTEKTGEEPGLNDTYLILERLEKGEYSQDYANDFYANPGNYYLYFVGDHVADVLDGASFLGKQNAIPIVGIFSGQSYPDASHSMLDTMLGYRSWATYNIPIEADLAMLQDLGYTIDRRKHFGYSLYNNNQNIAVTSGYSAKNADGTDYTGEYSDVAFGVGLHIYGTDNTVTQQGDILTKGKAAVGALVSGVRNTVSVAAGTGVHSDGDSGVGLQVAYGRNHQIELDGTLTADGANGIGAKFDFGTGSNGYTAEIRGSYISYFYNTENGELQSGANSTNLHKWYYNDYLYESDELDGALVDSFIVNGTLSGKSHAIYIGPSAFVKMIYINDGATVAGNITSEWKHFYSDGYRFGTTSGGKTFEKLGLHYNGKMYDYDQYIPDLVTDLYFNGDHTYDGNINGDDNIKVNITEGTTHFSGDINVLNVTVADDAALYGGTYFLHDMSDTIADGFTDTTTGTLYNYGTFGTDVEGKSVSIVGNLESAAGTTLMSAATDENPYDGILVVYGKATLADDVKAGGTQGKDGIVLQAYGSLQIGDEEEIKTSAMRIASGIIKASPLRAANGADDHEIIVGARLFGDNLGKKSEEQEEAFDVISMMDAKCASEEELPQELRTLENMTPAAAKSALTKIGNNEAAAHFFGRAQQKNIVGNRITSRMKETLGNPNAKISGERGLWVKTGKSWGDLDQATLGSSDIMFGYDRNIGENRIDGFFVSYSDENISENLGRAELYDTRIGYYSGHRMGSATGTFYADVGYVRGKTERNLGIGTMTAEGKPRTWLLEAGYQYKYDLKHGTNAAWHTSPYGKVRVSFARHKGYTEEGGGVFSQEMHGKSNFYGDAEIGVNLRRTMPGGNYGFTAGIRQVFAGLDPEFTFHYVSEPGTYLTRNAYQDKTRFLIGVDGNITLGKDWTLSGECRYEKGTHSRELSGAVSLEYHF